MGEELLAWDPDNVAATSAQSLQFSISSITANNGAVFNELFTISSCTPQLMLAPGQSLNFEDLSARGILPYTLQICASDDFMVGTCEFVTVQVLDVNEEPRVADQVSSIFPCSISAFLLAPLNRLLLCCGPTTTDI